MEIHGGGQAELRRLNSSALEHDWERHARGKQEEDKGFKRAGSGRKSMALMARNQSATITAEMAWLQFEDDDVIMTSSSPFFFFFVFLL